MANFRTHYANLQVSPKASDAVIRAAYKSLAQKYHPDKFEGTPAEAERIMKILNDANATLTDPAKRQEHDAWIRQMEDAEQLEAHNKRTRQMEEQARRAEAQRERECQADAMRAEGVEQRARQAELHRRARESVQPESEKCERQIQYEEQLLSESQAESYRNARNAILFILVFGGIGYLLGKR